MIESIVPMRPAQMAKNEIEGPDVLVVGGIQEPPPPGREVVLVMSLHIVMAEVGDGRHI
jgi:hypothetical protein